MSEVRILVVDDLGEWRQRIRSILQGQPELQIVDEASDGREAVQKGEALKPALILLDIGLPTLNGIEAEKRLFQLVPNTKVLFVSQNNDSDNVMAALSVSVRCVPSLVSTKSYVDTSTGAELMFQATVPRCG